MIMFQIKVTPPAEILTASRDARRLCFMRYQYNSVDEMPFFFDNQTETLYISEHAPEPQKITDILSRIVNRKSNGTKAQDRDYELLGSMFDDRVFTVVFDMFMHYFRKRAAEKDAMRKAVQA